MIADSLEHLGQYKMLPWLSEAAAYVTTHDLMSLPTGRIDISENVYILRQSITGKDLFEAKLEAHNRYADLQIILKGTECMGYRERAQLGNPVSGSADQDLFFYETDLSKMALLTIQEGSFAIFLPQDGHAPGLSCPDKSPLIEKAVVKIRVSD